MTQITADECVHEVSEYLKSALDTDSVDNVNVYEYEDKPQSYKGSYIAVNALPFVYGYALNDKCVMNVNVHVPTMSDGTYYRSKGIKLMKWLMSKIPTEYACEEDKELLLTKASYSVSNISQPTKDIDNTHYINFQLKVRFHQ